MNPTTPSKRSNSTRYDIHLALIPMILIGGIIAAAILSIPTHLAFGGAAVFALIPLIDVLFLHPPVQNGQHTQTTEKPNASPAFEPADD